MDQVLKSEHDAAWAAFSRVNERLDSIDSAQRVLIDMGQVDTTAWRQLNDVRVELQRAMWSLNEALGHIESAIAGLKRELVAAEPF